MMIGAAEAARMPRAGVPERSTTVQAHVVEGADAVGLPHDEDGIPSHVEGEVAAGALEIGVETGELPHPGPHLLELLAEEVSRDIAPLVDAGVVADLLPARDAMDIS